jgi:phage terminase small subunit
VARALTPRQAAFCRHMLEPGITATEAARKAGYSPTYADRQARQLLENPQVAAKLAALRADADDEAIISRAEVLRGMHTEATLYGEGASHSARVAAWAHLGKHLGIFTDKQEHTGAVTIRIIRD